MIAFPPGTIDQPRHLNGAHHDPIETQIIVADDVPNYAGPGYQTLTAARLLMSRAETGRPQLLALERASRMMAMPVRHGGIHKADAVDGLLAEANAIGLVGDIGEDVVAQTIARGLVDFSEPETPAKEIIAPPAAQYEGVGNSARALVTCNLSDIAPERIEWLWQGRVAIGKLTLIAGEPGLGKSQITLRVAATVTNGDKWPNCENDHAPTGSVIILSAEDGLADTTRPRFDAAGGDASRVGVIRAIETKIDSGAVMRSSFNLASDLALLEAEIIRRGDVRLVIIDPVSSYMGKTDSHKNTDVRGILEPIGDMAERLRVAVLAITHLSKGDGRAINRFIGSIAFVAAARAAFAVVTDPDDETGLRKLFLQVKNNIAAPAPGLAFRLEQMEIAPGIVASAVAWDSSPVTTTADQAMGALETGSHTATDDAEEFLLAMLASGPLSVGAIEAEARSAGQLDENQQIRKDRAFVRAKKNLGISVEDGTVYREGGAAGDGKWFWRLPPNAKAPKATFPGTGSLSDLSGSEVALASPDSCPDATKMPSLAYDAPIPERGTLDGLGHLSSEAGRG